MPSAETLQDPERLEAVRRTGLLDSTPEEAFDRLTRLVTRVLGVPMSIVTLVDADRQFFKSCIGVAEPWSSRRETPLTHSFCQHAVTSGAAFVVEDARAHPLVRDNLAIGDLGVVAYAGIPLRARDGAVLGTLCAIDSEPRRWTEEDLDALEAVAAAVLAEIELRTAPKERAPDGDRGALNISALAQRTGVASDTLRKWEQRYGILRPTRTAGGQRRYTERDVERVEWLKARLADGYRIGEAAALLGREADHVAHTPEEHRRAILDAIDRSDAKLLAIALDQAFALHALDELIAEIVEPVLVEVGERWSDGTFTVAQEHLASEAIRARLAHLLADTRGGVRGVAVLACAPGERHDLGLLMLAILMRADGWEVVFLGADTPPEDALATARLLNADLLGISAGTPEHIRHVPPLKDARVHVVVGGRGATAAEARRIGARHVNGNVRASVHMLRGLAG